MEKINKIITWLRKVYGDKPAIIAVSGGVDSAVALTLLTKALGVEKVIPVSLPYRDQSIEDTKLIVEFNKLHDKLRVINIGEMVDQMVEVLKVDEQVRSGNIMARVRMIVVFDLAKKYGALVCGTENKSEHELGYFTRFGDSASDVEPISSLYKTEVWEVAKKLGIPEIFWTKSPSAGLWSGQTDESEMGFGYLEADKVLSGQGDLVDQEILTKVKEMVEKNKFKLSVPYEFDE